MPYVMVPVPEEHVERVMRYVLKLVRQDELEDWDEESMHQFFAESDEITRAILSYVAQPDHAGRVRKDQAARSLELQRYLPKAVQSLKKRSKKDYGRVPPVRSEKESGEGPGQSTVPMLVMDEEVAELVRSAERAVHREEIQEEGTE